MIPDPEQNAGNPRSLDFQLACLRDVAVSARNDNIASGLAGLEATVIWLQEWAEVIKMVATLRKSRPELFQALAGISNTFPGARIEDYREMQP